MQLQTYQVTVFVAGDLDNAREALRRETYFRGLCVTVTPTTFIYTAGEEAGVAIGFVNYPRFPSTPEKIFERAVEIAEMLIGAMHQRTALVVGTDRTEWIVLEPPALKEKP